MMPEAKLKKFQEDCLKILIEGYLNKRKKDTKFKELLPDLKSFEI